MKLESNSRSRLVSLILPTYNEKDNIIPLIEEINNELKDYQYEIIIVDDNSPDGTQQVVKEYCCPRVKILVNRERVGLAASIRIGIEGSRGDLIVVMDSDFNHQPQYLRFMIDSLQYADCVSASRFLGAPAPENRVYQFFTRLFNVFTRVMVQGGMTDYFYGFFAIKRSCFERISLASVFYGYGDYYLRLIFYLEKVDRRILEFPAVNGRRLSGTGNRDLGGVFLRYFSEVIKLSFTELFLSKYIKEAQYSRTHFSLINGLEEMSTSRFHLKKFKEKRDDDSSL